MAGNAKLVAEMHGKYSAGQMFAAANRDMKRTAKQGKVLDNQFRMMRGGIGQMGHQVQDVAVQLQGGQNPFLILGQQGSQVASLFGPHGAVIGAFLAVGAAIASSMLPNLFGATEAMQKLNKAGDDLVDRFDELDGVLKAEALRRNAQEIANNKKVIADAEEAIRKMSGSMAMQNAIATDNQELIKQLNDELKEEHVNIALATEAIANLSKKTDDTSDATEKLIEKLTGEAGALGRTKEQQIRLTDAYKDATPANQKIIDDQLAKIRGYNELVAGIQAEQKALDDAAKAKEARDKKIAANEERLHMFFSKQNEEKNKASDRQAETDKEREEDLNAFFIKAEEDKVRAKSQLDNLMLNQASNVAGSLADMIAAAKGKESAAYKAAFAIQQGIAIATTIMNAEMAAVAALAPPPVGLGPVAGLPYSQIVRVMGYASAGIIAGQTLASFEGGGLTGSGVRSGGMDGKGGRLAMVHPNEKITDLHKGQGDSKVINVNFNIQANDTTGFDKLLNSRRGQIVSMVNQAVNNRGRSSLA